MNSIGPKLAQLEASLDNHLAAGEKCEAFFNAFNSRTLLPRGGSNEVHRLNVLAKLHKTNHAPFFQIFSEIDELGKWMKDYELICLQPSEGCDEKLKEVQQKIASCERVNDVFSSMMVKILRESPEILLNNEDLFFISGEGRLMECHCSRTMDRVSRRSFSQSFCSEIQMNFSQEKSLTIASIGAGYCFHELEIHALVTDKGYKIDRWVIVDPSIAPQTILNFASLLQCENPEVEVVAEQKASNEYFAEIEQGNRAYTPDVFLFIDVDLYVSSANVKKIFSKMKHHCCMANFTRKTMNFYHK